MKNPVILSFVYSNLVLLSGCGFKSDLYLSDITPVPDTVVTDLPTLPTLPPPDNAEIESIEPAGVAIPIPELEDDEKKKDAN